MAIPIKKTDGKYNYADYLLWPDDERWELIEGIPYSMSPAPSRIHQEILMEISGQIRDYLKEKPCKVYPAPLDVRFAETDEADDAITTVVQPDILVVCDEEILSPATSSKDMKEKFFLYEKYGVKEYWMVEPLDNSNSHFGSDYDTVG